MYVQNFENFFKWRKNKPTVQHNKEWTQSSNFKYKEGDYILLDSKILEKIHFKSDGLGKIDEILPNAYLPYLILFDNDIKLWMVENNIVRLLTTEEIELYESKLEATKYNL